MPTHTATAPRLAPKANALGGRLCNPALWGLVLAAIGSAAAADQPDPVELIRRSAEVVEQAESVSVTVDAATTLVRDEQTNTDRSSYVIHTAPDERFEFYSATPEGQPAKSGVRVAGNGRVMLVHAVAARRHTLSPGEGGLAALISSPVSSAVGSGLGGMVLAPLAPTTADALIESLTASEYLGREEVDGRPAHHARYTVADELSFDAWFAAEGEPVVLRIQPDVASTPDVRAMAGHHKTFQYRLVFDFNNWNLSAGLSAGDIAAREPSDSLLTGSLFAPPKEGPHPLLGKDAPAFTLTTPAGERVDLGERFGEGVVLLEFWATNCPICVQAMPKLEELHQRYADRGLEYFAINAGEAPGDVAAFLESRGLTARVLLDEQTQAADAYDVSSIPLIVLVGPDGHVQAVQAGFAPGDEVKLADSVEALLAGEDLATQTLRAHRRSEAEEAAQRERLQAALDG
ncbi:redoxin family protein [Botrimarina sp.]|uniref:redoxin family protein n=1 Tax=Botrimarina sp. TaxID=2795802 RepID=UPI0032EC1570